MREINKNNMNSVNFKGIRKPAAENAAPAESAASAPANAESKEIKDLSNLPAAALGKSMVASDSLESDMKFLEKNPALVAQLNQAIDSYAQNHSEEDTLKMIEKVHEEFVTKK